MLRAINMVRTGWQQNIFYS